MEPQTYTSKRTPVSEQEPRHVFAQTTRHTCIMYERSDSIKPNPGSCGLPGIVKWTLVLGVLVILTHIFVVGIKGRGTSTGHESATFLNDRGRSSDVNTVRVKKDLSSGAHLPNSVIDVESDTLTSVVRETPKERYSGKDQCRNGHIQGLGPFCDSNGCLVKLHKDFLIPHPGFIEGITHMSNANVSFVPTLDVTSVPVSHKYLEFASILAKAQWNSNIYGSVGLFESEHTLFSEYFVMVAQLHSAERLFKWRISSQAGYSALQSHSLHEEMPHNSVTGSRVNSRPVATFQGESSELSKNLFVEENLPQFRFIAITEDKDALTMVSTLETASCLLRDGGIIVVQGHFGSTDPLKLYFNKHGTSALSPCLKVKNKYFLCTTNWKDRIIADFLNSSELSPSHMFHKESSDIFGTKNYYLSFVK